MSVRVCVRVCVTASDSYTKEKEELIWREWEKNDDNPITSSNIGNNRIHKRDGAKYASSPSCEICINAFAANFVGWLGDNVELAHFFYCK